MPHSNIAYQTMTPTGLVPRTQASPKAMQSHARWLQTTVADPEGSGGSLEPPTCSLFLNILWKWNNLISTVRGITCISYNIYHLKKLKLCLFNNDFKVNLSKVTYLGYIWNYLRQGQILVRQKYNSFKLKSSLFSDFQWPRVQISRRCVHTFYA